MSYSLNEVEATAKRATRGAGRSWGIAEESSKATRWLCAQGLSGATSLARLLDLTNRKAADSLAPATLTGEWSNTEVGLCPLVAGAALSDCAARLTAGDVVMHNVLQPALILPFAAAVARQQQSLVTVAWEGLVAVTDGTALRVDDPDGVLMTKSAAQLHVTSGGELADPLTRQTRATPDPDDWAALNRFAARTYAPATEASRLLGAGAGLADND